MCELCLNTHSVSVYNRYDPTHTTTLRNRLVSNFNRRFDELARVVRGAVDEHDCFGLKNNYKTTTYQLNPPYGRSFAFTSDQRKVAEFLKWLDEMVKKGLFTIEEIQQVGESIYPLWSNKYITEAYKRGIYRARMEMRRAGYEIPDAVLLSGIGFFMTPVHIERAGLLYIRNYNELKGITDDMAKLIARVLAEGLMNGEQPSRIARKMVAVINGAGVGELGLTDKLGRFIPAKRRAQIMARTEIIRAHHLATIQEYRNWGVAGVEVIAEFLTARDDRVCGECASLDGQQFTLDVAEGLIPVHPQCRCCVVPIPVKR